MERGLVMLLHSIIIGVMLYLLMIGLKQQPNVAENRSILLAACCVIYMILFGHSMPNKMNPI